MTTPTANRYGSSGDPLVMTLLVRDEADIIRQNIEFHLSRGVDHVIATDNASTDGTTDILEEFARAGCLSLIREPSNDYRQMAWVNRMIALATEKFGEIWLINNDADEFWRPPDNSEGRVGNLRDVLTASPSPSVLCRRRNMITSPDRLGAKAWSEALVWRSMIETRPNAAELARPEPMEHPFFCYNLPNKVLMHSRNLVSVTKGCHSATFRDPVKPVDLGIEIFHYPIRSISEFTASVTHIYRAILRDVDRKPQESTKYIRWANILERTGSTRKLVEDALPTRSQLWRYRLSGKLVKDHRMRNDLAGI
ncbi:glycosyltransferase family 2 protein [Hyphomicrobium sp. DY-1]|uniref:glycosyltransferase family 2 protein n=1 Tax=Hyphomicrobium sp. DY-1 TaxID=3075650 RepID=UPI0039C3418B